MKRNFNIHDLRIFYAVVMTGSTGRLRSPCT